MTLTWILLQSSLWGLIRGGLSFVMEHPLDAIKTCWQADPAVTSWRGIAQDIYQKKGWLGFYAGLIPNTLRAMLKHAYRMPLMLFCHYIVMLVWQAEAPILVGCTIALLEVGIIQPLERLKVWIMTSPYKGRSIRCFFKEKHHQTLYQGFSASCSKQVVSWVVFLWADYELRQVFLGDHASIIIPLLVGFFNTLAVLPFDAIKTRMQCYTADKNLSWLATLKMIASHYGMRGFYVGFSVRLLQYTIQALWTMLILYTLLPHIQKITIG